jgi:Na+-transporting methylmalonyl-CoA/oxaloacetate decarboxylase gamma subunit
MINVLTTLGIFFGIVILVILSVCITTFGTLIANTEDKQDRIGKRKEKTDAPARHAKIYVYAVWTIYLGGVSLIVLSEYIRVVIVGTVLVFSALLFAGTVLWWAMGSYSKLKKNERELKGSWVA